MALTHADTLKFAAMLDSVADELKVYAARLRRDGPGADVEEGTYTLIAQGAVFDLMVEDKMIRKNNDRT